MWLWFKVISYFLLESLTFETSWGEWKTLRYRALGEEGGSLRDQNTASGFAQGGSWIWNSFIFIIRKNITLSILLRWHIKYYVFSYLSFVSEGDARMMPLGGASDLFRVKMGFRSRSRIWIMILTFVLFIVVVFSKAEHVVGMNSD